MKRILSVTDGLRSAKLGFAVFCIWLTFGCNAAFSQTVQQKPWEILQAGLSERSTSERAAATKALGLLRGDPRAIECAEKALGDKKSVVREAAAIALGQMGSWSSAPLLKRRWKTGKIGFLTLPRIP